MDGLLGDLIVFVECNAVLIDERPEADFGSRVYVEVMRELVADIGRMPAGVDADAGE